MDTEARQDQPEADASELSGQATYCNIFQLARRHCGDCVRRLGVEVPRFKRTLLTRL